MRRHSKQESGARSLEWDISMFFPGIAIALVFKGPERTDDPRARLRRLYHRIHITALGSHEWVGKSLPELRDFLLAELFTLRGGCSVQLAFVDDVYRPFRAHHGNFRGRPRKVRVGADVLAGHDAIRASVGLARDHRDLRHRRLGKRKQQLRAVLDNAPKLLLRTGKKTGNVFKSDQRNIERIAESHEPRSLNGSIDIQHSRQVRGLIRDDADGPAIQPR